jgi:hypothetical protein
MKLPKARTNEMLEQELNDELMVYDTSTHKAYSLNETSKNIFRACNGATSFDDLKKRYGYTDDLIYFTLDELKRNDLLKENLPQNRFAGLSRREVIKRVGLTCAVALPIVTGLNAPLAARAASTCALNTCIAANQDICTGCEGQVINFTTYTTTDGTCGTVDQTNGSTTCAFSQQVTTDITITSVS